MPVRDIPKNYRNITGKASSNKTETAYFESGLERDFLSVLEFDKDVVTYDVQPVAINWFDTKGKLRKYTPDVLVKTVDFETNKKTITLYEVKYRDDIRKNWKELKAKFKVGIRFAKKQGWRFKLITEKEIKTPYTDNARFLVPYVNQTLNEAFENLILDKLSALDETSVEVLLSELSKDPWRKAEILPTIWKLVGDKRIGCDLFLPITMASPIWDVGE
ncbi:MAG: TnsA endonuclease N-terminal domain-containing protein [Idiomarina sp.]